MERVLVVVRAFEDFEIGDMIIEDECSESGLAEEHRHKAVTVAVRPPIGHDPEEV